MIQYIEMGYGLHEHLAVYSVYLDQGQNGEWRSTASDEKTNELISQYNPWPYEKAKKLNEINDWFAAAVGQLTAGTTQTERDSWAVQVNEAYGIRPVAMLAAMANARGIELETLIARVKQKSELFAAYYGAIQGKRDSLEDLVKSFPDSGECDRLPELWALSCMD